MSELPLGTVTLILADVEGSTRLWETDAASMAIAMERLGAVLSEVLPRHGGVRPVEQGEGDSFVVAFTRASDAIACALEIQLADLDPIRLRIGVHTGEIGLRDEGNYAGPTINRAARLRDLAHGGQTVLSGSAAAVAADHLSEGMWLEELGIHELRDLARPERVVQLCHPDLRTEFPGLRTSHPDRSDHLPRHLTRFIGRHGEVTEIEPLLRPGALVTLTGAGGVGKTRLAVQIARGRLDEFTGGVFFVDLGSIVDPEVVPRALAEALGLPDQLGSTVLGLTRYIVGRRMLVVMDNCEHLVAATSELVAALLAAAPELTVFATSREPLGLMGEVTWQVPSLSLTDEALDLFCDRALRTHPGLRIDADELSVIVEICRRLDGIPLAIELAAARLRALTVTEIRDSLHDRFRLLTGGARTSVRRQQTLWASVDWSFSLLTEPERVLFRRLAVFSGSFDLVAAQQVCCGDAVERHQILDQLTLLVEKSLIVAESTDGRTRYRMLETVRQYAQVKLGESGEADEMRDRHLGHYGALAAAMDAPDQPADDLRLDRIRAEIDNLRAAFRWSCEHRRVSDALRLVSSLQPLWLARGQIREGLDWLKLALAQTDGSDATLAAERAAAIADLTVLMSWTGLSNDVEQADSALATARGLAEPLLLARTLAARGCISAHDVEAAAPYFAEGIELARQLNDGWRLSQMLGWRAYGAIMSGDVNAIEVAAREGLAVAEAIGNRFQSRQCRWELATALTYRDLPSAVVAFEALVAEASAARDSVFYTIASISLSYAQSFHGEPAAALAAARQAVDESADLVGFYEGISYSMLTLAGLAAGELDVAWEASELAWARTTSLPLTRGIYVVYSAEAALVRGELALARDWSDSAVSRTRGWHQAAALTVSARVSLAQGDIAAAERDLRGALAVAVDTAVWLWVPDGLECLADVASSRGALDVAARMLGAAQAIRTELGSVRLAVYGTEADECLSRVRDELGDNDFNRMFGEGTELSRAEAVAYALRGRGGRKRPATGWASLTPMEREVVVLVVEGLGNREIAARLFVSPRTVQTHLTHVYAKLGVASRVTLAQVAGRNLQAGV